MLCDISTYFRTGCWFHCARHRHHRHSRCRLRLTGSRCLWPPRWCCARGLWFAVSVEAGKSWTHSADGPNTSENEVVISYHHHCNDCWEHSDSTYSHSGSGLMVLTCSRSRLVSSLSTFSSSASPADTFTSSRSPSFCRMSRPLCSSWALAWGNSWSASIRSCLERQNRSEYPRLRILAVRRFPILLPLMFRMLISPKQLPEVSTANWVTPSSPTTASWPSLIMYISLPTSPLEKNREFKSVLLTAILSTKRHKNWKLT